MSIKFVSLFLIAALIMAGCGVEINVGGGNIIRGSGNIKSEDRPVSGFSSVSITGSGNATLTLGDTESLRIEAEDNILPLIEANVQNGKLVIGLRSGTSISTSRPIRYTISLKTVNGVETSGSGDAAFTNAMITDSLTARTSGSGGIHFGDVTAKSFTAVTSGSGKIDASGGKVDNLSVTTSGSGDFNAPNLQAASANASTSGSGNITLWVKDTLTARTSGSGNVKYYGQPSVNRMESGSGRISSLGNK